MSAYRDALPDLRSGEVALLAVGGQILEVRTTGETGIHSGRRRYRVECRCGELVHSSTTGPRFWSESHVREKHGYLGAPDARWHTLSG